MFIMLLLQVLALHAPHLLLAHIPQEWANSHQATHSC